MELEIIIGGVGLCSVIFAAFFVWWFCDCFGSRDTVIVVDGGHPTYYGGHTTEVVTYEEYPPAYTDVVVEAEYEY